MLEDTHTYRYMIILKEYTTNTKEIQGGIISGIHYQYKRNTRWYNIRNREISTNNKEVIIVQTYSIYVEI